MRTRLDAGFGTWELMRNDATALDKSIYNILLEEQPNTTAQDFSAVKKKIYNDFFRGLCVLFESTMPQVRQCSLPPVTTAT